MYDIYDVIIIGSGVSGSYIARELSRYKLKILLLDKENDVANETTAANSAIIHAGYDAKPGTTMAQFNAPGNLMFDQVCEELDVPFERCGSLVVGFNDDDRKTIKKLYENAIKNGVPDVRIIEHDEILKLEPNLNPGVECALYAPSAGIINPWELAIALAENAIDNGIDLKLETKVTNIIKENGIYNILTNKGSFKSKLVINCAGVYADEIHNMVSKPSYSIRPRRGQYFVLDNSVKELVDHVIFQAPTIEGKGVLIVPTVDGNYLIGPDSRFIDDKDDVATEAERLDFVKSSALRACTQIPFDKVIRTFAGLRATSNLEDFIIGQVEGEEGFIEVGGYESPGLSSIPAVANYVVSLVNKISGGLEEKDTFNPRRRKVVRFNKLSPKEQSHLIKETPSYGNVICRCEAVTEAEIVDCIHRNAGARSVKGVKKRVRPGAGRCQGGFCGPRIVDILARELKCDRVDVPYDSTDAYILVGETKELGDTVGETNESGGMHDKL